jgi:hypothetical protein
MKSRRPSRKERKLRNKARAKSHDQTLIWPFLMV